MIRKFRAEGAREIFIAAEFPSRGKSVDIKREENPNRIAEEPAVVTSEPQPTS
jgi:hypothetical protein